MAHLPPSSVFGALPQTDAVHVLFLIENSLPMVEHLYTLQRQLLPSVLGAIRLANPGTDVRNCNFSSPRALALRGNL